MTQLIRQAERSRTPRQLLIEQVAGFFVPVVLSVAACLVLRRGQSEDQMMQKNAMKTAVVNQVAPLGDPRLASPSRDYYYALACRTAQASWSRQPQLRR